jgi:hypothetical protein
VQGREEEEGEEGTKEEEEGEEETKEEEERANASKVLTVVDLGYCHDLVLERGRERSHVLQNTRQNTGP